MGPPLDFQTQLKMEILVVGGTKGIGAALVQGLVHAGHSVTVLARNAPQAPAPGVAYHQHDATAGPPPKELFPEVLHGLAYCPGSITLKPFQSLKPAQFLHDFHVNVLGAVNVLQAAYPALRKAEGAGVVLFSTVAAATGMNFHASIAAAKSAVEGLTKSLAAEWARNQIRVNAVAPSITDTPLAAQLLSDDKKRENSANRHPLARVGTPEDMAAAAQFLLTNAHWVTGQVLHVDGGLSSLRPL